MANRKEKRSRATKEFSRFAKAYDQYNIIQSEVAKTLIDKLASKRYGTIIDIGAGSGKVYKYLLEKDIAFERFIALDSSSEMLDIHPEEESTEKICADFNEIETFKALPVSGEILLLSSSALQWSKDPDLTFQALSKLSSQAYFAIFTSNTFKTLHHYAGIDSPIYSENRLKEVIGRYYDASYEVRHYKLYFDSVRDMFLYIKKSGVSGGEKKLGYKEIKTLMSVYPFDYLEFEVLFAEGTPKGARYV